jgi:hypothetical protein
LAALAEVVRRPRALLAEALFHAEHADQDLPDHSEHRHQPAPDTPSGTRCAPSRSSA